MRKKRIAEALNIRINLGNYQHVQLTKYVDEVIEFETEEQRLELEDKLNDELVCSMIKAMRATPKRLGTDLNGEAVQKVETAIKTAIPEWLENDPIPNLANAALEAHEDVIEEQKENKEKQEAKLAGKNDMVNIGGGKSEIPETPKAPKVDKSSEDIDIFDIDGAVGEDAELF